MSGSLSPSLPTALPDPAFLAEIQRVLQPYRDAAAGSQDMPSSAPSAVQGMARAVQTPASSDQNPGLPDWASGSRRAPSQPTQPQPQSNGAALSGRVDPQAALGFDPSDVLPAKGTALLNSLPTIGQPTAGMVARGVPVSQTGTLDSLAPVGPTPGMLAAGTYPASSQQPSGSAAGQGGPDALAALGIDPADVQPHATAQSQGAAAQPAAQPSWSNIGGAIPSGLYRGIANIPNLPGNAANLAMTGLHQVFPSVPTDYFKPIVNPNPTGYQPAGPIASNLENAAAAVGTTAALGGVGKLVAGALTPGTIPQAIAQTVGQTGPGTLAASAAGGAAEEPAANQVPDEWKPVARMLANVGAGAGVGAVGGAGRAAIGAVGPETAQLAQLARDTYNIPIRAGQIGGNRVVRSADSALQSVPFSGLQDAAEVQQSALNKAVAQTFGEDADKITPSVLNAAHRRIGGVMQDVENRNNIQFDPQLGQDLSGIVQNARMALPDSEFGVVGRQVQNLLSTVQPGAQISGQSYGNLIHKGSPLDAMMNSSDSNIANYGGQIREALRDLLQRSLSS